MSGASVNEPRNDGQTPLIALVLACTGRLNDRLRHFLTFVAQMDLEEEMLVCPRFEGKTASEFAKDNGSAAIADILAKYPWVRVL